MLPQDRIAVIGTGISGSLTARMLASRYDVTVYEAKRHAGGHANTVDVELAGRTYAVDTGFMVFNRRTYPRFGRLLDYLRISSQSSDMSFSVRCSRSGLEYQGSSLNGLFAQRRNCLRPSFMRMLCDIVRFNQLGNAAAASGELKDGRTVGQFLQQCSVRSQFVQNYLTPMAAAIWSSKPEAILDFPAEFMIGFFANHGLMQVKNRPQWRTIRGGSRMYVNALLDPIRDRVRLECPVASVTRAESHVVVTPVDGQPEIFDQVVFASHADQTLEMLHDATPAEREVLSAFPYRANDAVLHTDTETLPRRRRAWASWNYHIDQRERRAASVTYDLSRLQNLDSPTPILLTLNESESIDPAKVIRTFTYHHPGYSCESIDAQRRFAEVSGQHRTHFCGAYWGYGFHEDGVNSALAVARRFGIEFEPCTVASTKESSSTVAASP